MKLEGLTIGAHDSWSIICHANSTKSTYEIYVQAIWNDLGWANRIAQDWSRYHELCYTWIKCVAWLWALPTPQSILTVGLVWELSHPISNNKLELNPKPLLIPIGQLGGNNIHFD